MRSRVIQVVAAVLLPAVSAHADPPPGDDLLGFYTAADGNGLANVDVAVGEMVTIHMCLTGCTADVGVVCWEWGLDVPAGVVFLGAAYDGCAEDWGCLAECSFCLTCGPLACDEVVPVGEFTFLVTEPGPQYFHLHPHPTPTVPGTMSYLDADLVLHPMTPSSGREDCAVFGINTGPLDCDGETIAVEERSWSVVRRLYE